jgi:hypothetical protein
MARPWEYTVVVVIRNDRGQEIAASSSAWARWDRMSSALSRSRFEAVTAKPKIARERLPAAAMSHYKS